MAATLEEVQRLYRQAGQAKGWNIIGSNLPESFKLRFKGTRRVEVGFQQVTGKFVAKFFGTSSNVYLTMSITAPGLASLTSQVQNKIDQLSSKGFYQRK